MTFSLCRRLPACCWSGFHANFPESFPSDVSCFFFMDGRTLNKAKSKWSVQTNTYFSFFPTIYKHYETGRPVARHGVACAKFRQVSAVLLLLETRPGTFVTPNRKPRWCWWRVCTPKQRSIPINLKGNIKAEAYGLSSLFSFHCWCVRRRMLPTAVVSWYTMRIICKSTQTVALW